MQTLLYHLRQQTWGWDIPMSRLQQQRFSTACTAESMLCIAATGWRQSTLSAESELKPPDPAIRLALIRPCA